MKQTNTDNHITVDEMIKFVSFDKMDKESFAIASKVATHIRNCDDCMQKVNAYQLIYDELVRLGHKERFKNVVHGIDGKEKQIDKEEVDR